MTLDTNLTRATNSENLETKVNPANHFLESKIRPLLGDVITNFWLSQTESWQQRFVTKSLSQLAAAVGEIPSTVAKTDVDADKLIKFKLEHWMIGADINVAGNLAVSLATGKLLHPAPKSEMTTMLQVIGGAQSRMSWERKHELALHKIIKEPIELQEQLIADENKRYASPLNKLQYLQRNQKNFVAKRTKQHAETPQEFNAFIERKNRHALHKFNQYSESTQVVLGRDDRANFIIRYESGPWTQASLVEESKIKFSEPKGVSVTFYRFSEQTGEKEFFVCYGKRDAFTRTHQLTPAWQTSITRAKAGNHPDQEYNPMLTSLKDAFSKAQSANGVEISYIDANPNRNNESPIAIATIDWASYSQEDQDQILEVMVKENGNKPLLHSWVPESKVAILRRQGLVDKNGEVGPAVNGFLSISLGSRSPTEIIADGINRLAYQDLQKLFQDNPEVTLEMINLEVEKLLASPETAQAGHLINALFLLVAGQGKRHQEVRATFPHSSHELNAEN